MYILRMPPTLPLSMMCSMVVSMERVCFLSGILNGPLQGGGNVIQILEIQTVSRVAVDVVTPIITVTLGAGYNYEIIYEARSDISCHNICSSYCGFNPQFYC